MIPTFHSLSRSLRRILSLCILVPALIAAVLMTVAFFTQYDAPEANYFRHGAALPVVAGLFAALSALVGSICAFLTPKGVLQTESLPFPNASLTEAIGFLFCAAFLVVSIARDHTGLLRLIPLVLSLGAVVYAFTVAFGRLSAERTRNFAVPFGFAPIFTCIFLCAVHYFDRSLEMNAPCKVYLILGLLTAIVAFTGELHYLLGTANPRVCLMLLSWTVAAGSLCIPAIPAAYFFGILSKTDYIASSFAVLGCLLTSVLRLLALLNYNTDKQNTEEPDTMQENNA